MQNELHILSGFMCIKDKRRPLKVHGVGIARYRQKGRASDMSHRRSPSDLKSQKISGDISGDISEDTSGDIGTHQS